LLFDAVDEGHKYITIRAGLESGMNRSGAVLGRANDCQFVDPLPKESGG
jgi:hypothetical protein